MNMEIVHLPGTMGKYIKENEIINTCRIIRDNTENKDAAKFSISWYCSKGS